MRKKIFWTHLHCIHLYKRTIINGSWFLWQRHLCPLSHFGWCTRASSDAVTAHIKWIQCFTPTTATQANSWPWAMVINHAWCHRLHCIAVLHFGHIHHHHRVIFHGQWGIFITLGYFLAAQRVGAWPFDVIGDRNVKVSINGRNLWKQTEKVKLKQNCQFDEIKKRFKNPNTSQINTFD